MLSLDDHIGDPNVKSPNIMLNLSFKIYCWLKWSGLPCAWVAAVLGAVIVLAVVAAVTTRPLFVSLSSVDLQTGFSTTVEKTPNPLREK